MRWVYTRLRCTFWIAFFPLFFLLAIIYFLLNKQWYHQYIVFLHTVCSNHFQFFFSTQKSSILFMKWKWKRKHSRALLHRQKCRNDERKKAKPEKKMLKVYVSFFIHFIIYSSHFLFHTWCDRCVFLLGMRVCGFVSNVREKHLPFLKWLWLLLLFLLHTNDWSYFLKVTNISKATATPSLCAPLNAGIKLKSMTHNIFLRRLSSKFKSKSKSKSKHKFLVGLK